MNTLKYEMQTYRQFLYELGSIIKKGKSTQHKVRLIGIRKHGFPTDYTISQNLELILLQKPMATRVNGAPRVPYFNSIPKKLIRIVKN